MGKRIEIVVADRQPLFLEAVIAMLETEPDLAVVGTAADGMQAVSEVDRAQPDVAVLDLDLPNCDGVRATRSILEGPAGCGILLIAEARDRALLLEAVRAGASGFLTRGSPLNELIEAIRTIHLGEMSIPRGMLRPLIDDLVGRRAEQDRALRRALQLTRREKEVLGLLVEGANNDQIAQALVISPQTARTHIQNVLAKLGVHSRLEAASFVLRNGIEPELPAVGG
jgi:DNA-binding NarL/FixJ family response regulator